MSSVRLPCGLLLAASRLCTVVPALEGCAERVRVPGEVPAVRPSGAWRVLLRQASNTEGVDYRMVAKQANVLERYLTWVGEHGPQMDELRESQEDRRITFLVNAYNAAVVYGVIEYVADEQPPLASVRDLRVGPWRWKGTGFFWGLQFRVDGEWIDLYHLGIERIVNRYQEPLLHVALHGGARSSPPLVWWNRYGLQDQLIRQMSAFLATDRGLRKAPDGSWQPNAIFCKYRDDFIDWTDAEDLCDWMSRYTTGAAQIWLSNHIGRCDLTCQPFDWSLDEISLPEPAATTTTTTHRSKARRVVRPPRRKVIPN